MVGHRTSKLLLLTVVAALASLGSAAPTAADEAPGDGSANENATNPWDLSEGGPAELAPEPVEPEPYEFASVAEGMEYSSATTYTVDVDSSTVHAVVEITAKNVKPSVSDGYRRTSYYFGSVYHPVPLGVLDVAATSGGRDLVVELEEVEEGDVVQWARIDLRRNLHYGQTRDITLSFTMPSGDPRGDDDVVVNGAHVSFSAYAFGDAAAASVTLSVPEGFVVDVFGPWVEPVTSDGRNLYVYEAIERPLEFYVFLSGENVDGLVVEELTVSGLDVDIEAWPGDDEWADFMAEQVPDALVALEELIGIERPDIGELDVRESAAPYLYGYAGWYNADEGFIEVGDRLDHHVLYHELGHIWFNDELFAERWFTEGLADDFAARVVAELGVESDWEPESVALSAPGAVRLNAWTTPSPFDDNAEERESWAYNASWWVFEQIREDVGDEAMGEILDAAAADLTAYRGEVDPEVVQVDRNWQRFLDLAEELGASEKVGELFDLYVLTDSQRPRVERRAESRGRYAELGARGDSWATPPGVRFAMDRWRFAVADDLMTEAHGLLDRRDELQERAAQLDLAVHGDLEVAYESVLRPDDVGAASDVADDHLAAMNTVDAARREFAGPRPFGTRVGLWGTDPAIELADVEAAYVAGDLDAVALEAGELTAMLDDAVRVGRLRIQRTVAGIVGALVALVTAMVLLRRRRKRRRAALGRSVDAVASTHGETMSVAGGSDDLGDDDAADSGQVIDDGPAHGGPVLHGPEVSEPLHGQ